MILEFQAGRMLVKVFNNRNLLGERAAIDAVEAVKQVINERGECNIVFAAAPSQKEFLNALCLSDIDWNKVNAFHMDEYVGLSADHPKSFANFLKHAIFEKVNFKSVNYFNTTGNIEEEISRYSKLLVEHPLDIAFMGIGENAHIAFNDPHVSNFDDIALVKLVELDQKCRSQQVNDGCFPAIEDVPKNALTLTIPCLFNVKRIFCMVPAASKAEAVTKTVFEEIRETVPSSILRKHDHAILYLDAESGKGILNKKVLV